MLKKQADRERVSLNQYIVYVLTQAASRNEQEDVK